MTLAITMKPPLGTSESTSMRKIWMMANINRSVYALPMEATSNGVFQGDNPLDFALPLAILQICIITVLTCGLAYFLKPLKQPHVIAEIIVISISKVKTSCNKELSVIKQ